jgi:hypothetical protein
MILPISRRARQAHTGACLFQAGWPGGQAGRQTDRLTGLQTPHVPELLVLSNRLARPAWPAMVLWQSNKICRPCHWRLGVSHNCSQWRSARSVDQDPKWKDDLPIPLILTPSNPSHLPREPNVPVSHGRPKRHCKLSQQPKACWLLSRTGRK